MKTKTIPFSLMAMLAVTVLTFQSCKKDEDKTNQLPACEITSPTSGQEITKGETITISAEVNDSDGTITEVRFAVDGVGKGSASSYPYNYNWTTNNESIGSHSIKTTCIDNDGGNTSDEITVEIIDGGNAGTYTDPRDGQTYTTIEIGSQTWFAENLNYLTTHSWWYNNNSFNGEVYGRLYTWEAAMTACPSGWHLPSTNEWKQLEMELGMSQSEVDDYSWRGTNEGEKMKSTSGWYNNGIGTNSSGFNALPGSNWNDNGSFGGLGDGGLGSYGIWWSASPYFEVYAWARSLSYDSKQVFNTNYNNDKYGLSVRCIKD